MRILLLSFLLLIGGNNKVTKIAKTNELKKEAKKAFENANYETAIEKYKILQDSFDIEDDNITLNLANSYYYTNDTLNALDSYKSIIAGDNNKAKSLAYQQLGVISGDKNELKQSLDFFKEALRNNPFNEEARYNYELTKKKLEEQEKQNQDQQNQDQDQENKDNKDQENKDQQKQDQKDQNQENKEGEKNEEKSEDQKQQDQQNKEGEGEQQDEQKQKEQEQQQKEDEGNEEKKEEQQPQPKDGEEKKEGEEKSIPQSISDKLKEMNLSPEKAQMILEAMKNSEIQYIQQNKRKPTKRKDSSKPDW